MIISNHLTAAKRWLVSTSQLIGWDKITKVQHGKCNRQLTNNVCKPN